MITYNSNKFSVDGHTTSPYSTFLSNNSLANTGIENMVFPSINSQHFQNENFFQVIQFLRV